MTPTTNIITDSYTRRGRINPEPGLHGGIEVVYKPMLARSVEEMDDTAKQAGAKNGVAVVAAALQQQLQQWSETIDGKPAPITADNVSRLPYPLLIDLRRLVTGVWAGDALPNATEEEQSDFTKALQLAAAGKGPGQEQLAGDLKN